MPESISVRQLNALVFVYLVANFDVFEPRIVASRAGGDSLVSVILATLLALLLPVIWFTLARRFPQADVVQYSRTVLGSPLGQAAGALYLFILVLGGARPSSKAGLIGTTAFGWGPAVAVPVVILLLVVAALLARRGLQSIASLCEYAAPLAIIVVLVVGATVWGKVDWGNYTFLPTGWGPAWRGAMTLLARFAIAGYVLLLLLPRTRNAGTTTLLTMGTLFTVGMLMAVGTLSIGLNGAGATAASLIPSLELLSAGIFGRSPVVFNLVVAAWMAGLTIKAATAYWLLSTCLAETAGTSGRRFLVPAGAAIGLLTLVLWSNPGQAYIFVEHYSRYITYAVGLGIPLLLLLAARLRWPNPGPGVPQT